MSSFQDGSFEQNNLHGPSTFTVGDTNLTHSSFPSQNAESQGAMAQYQGQTTFAALSGEIQNPIMQQNLAIVDGSGRLPVPSGLPENALPGNMGTMRPQLFHPNMDGGPGNLVQLNNIQHQQGQQQQFLQTDSSAMISDTSDMQSHLPIGTSDNKLYSQVNQYPTMNNNNNAEQIQLPSQLSLPGPVFVHQPPSLPNSAVSEPTDPRIGNGQLPPGYGQSMYPNNSFPMQQQQHSVHPKQLQNLNQHQWRPRMEAMPQRMIGPRQQMPLINPNVFPGGTPSSQHENWQQQNSNIIRGNQLHQYPQNNDQFSMTPNTQCQVSQPVRFPEAHSFNQQNWRPNNPVPSIGVQNSLPNVSENYSSCITQPQVCQHNVPSINQQSNGLQIQASSQDSQVITTVPVKISVNSSFQGVESLSNPSQTIMQAQTTMGFQTTSQNILSGTSQAQIIPPLSMSSSLDTNLKMTSVSFVTQGHTSSSQQQIPHMTMAHCSGPQLSGQVPSFQGAGQMPIHQHPGVAVIPQNRPKFDQGMSNPNLVQMNQRIPGVASLRGPTPINFNSLSNDQQSQLMNVQPLRTGQQQEAQIFPPQMIPVGASMPLVIAGSMANVMQDKVTVPWGWKRVLIGENIVYFSPSGIQLKTGQEIKEYLMTEGTCKCGLECPVTVENVFDFDQKKLSDISHPNSIPVKNTGCKHVNDTLAIAQIQSKTGFNVRHLHNPVFTKGKDLQKRKTKSKKKPFSGVLVSQMLAAREAEKQRIVEIIAQQKAEHEATLKMKSKEEDEKQAKPKTPKKSIPAQKANLSQLDLVTADAKNQSDNDSDTQVKQNSETDSSTHLSERMLHPAMLQSSKLMNLGSAAQIFGSEKIVISPKNLSRRSSLENTPTAAQDTPRPFSLAEAMQAARKLNLDPQSIEEDGEKDDKVANNSDLDSNQEDVDDNESVTSDEDKNDIEGTDNAKNIEIRRLSNTDEGNKVLEPHFHSPDKEAKKNPLQNIFNIVSGMELPPPTKSSEDPRNPQPNSGMYRPQLKGKRRGLYSGFNQLTPNTPPWPLGGPQNPMQMQNIRGMRPMLHSGQMVISTNQQQQQPFLPNNQAVHIPGPVPSMLPSQGQQVFLAGQPGGQVQFIQQGNPGQAIIAPSPTVQSAYQLVQTANGTMLMQIPQPQTVGVDGNMVQIQTVQPNILCQGSPSSSGSSSKSSSPGSLTQESPKTKKKGNKRKLGVLSNNQPPQLPQQQILLSPNIAQSNGQQFVAIGQLPQASNMVSPQVVPQSMIINPPTQQMVLANGTLVAIPQNQGIMYQQLPDGTLVQVASHMPMIQQQQIMAAPPVQGQVMVTAEGQLIHGGAPQLLMTPQGLVQAVGPSMAGINNQNIGSLTEQKKQNKKKGHTSRKAKSSSSDTSMDQDNTDGGAERDSLDDHDTSFEDPQPSTSKEFSPRSSIQSNQVDSSGLNATPPYLKDGDYEQLRSESDLDLSPPELDTSLENSRHSRVSGVSTPASNLSLMEERVSECDSDLDQPVESPKPPKLVSSSKERRKKKKKKKRSHKSGGNKLGDIVWGPANGFSSWPGKIVSQDEDRSRCWVCWFTTKQVTQVEKSRLKTLSEGLEDHHRERKNSRKGKKINVSLEKAIQEAMSELD